MHLHDGYDWRKTRKTIEDEIKGLRRRLLKIKQLMAQGHDVTEDLEEGGAFLFNSVHLGLWPAAADMEPHALEAAIDHELGDELGSDESWQSLPAPRNRSSQPVRPRLIGGKELFRSQGAAMEFRMIGLSAEFDQYESEASLQSRFLVCVEDLEILDHLRTSTWQKFLTSLRSDSRGNVRETGSNMLRVEYRVVCPIPGNPSQEARLRVAYIHWNVILRLMFNRPKFCLSACM